MQSPSIVLPDPNSPFNPYSRSFKPFNALEHARRLGIEVWDEPIQTLLGAYVNTPEGGLVVLKRGLREAKANEVTEHEVAHAITSANTHGITILFGQDSSMGILGPSTWSPDNQRLEGAELHCGYDENHEDEWLDDNRWRDPDKWPDQDGEDLSLRTDWDDSSGIALPRHHRFERANPDEVAADRFSREHLFDVRILDYILALHKATGEEWHWGDIEHWLELEPLLNVSARTLRRWGWWYLANEKVSDGSNQWRPGQTI